MAGETGRVDIVKYLVENGAQVNVVDKVSIDMYNTIHLWTSCVVALLYFFKTIYITNDETDRMLNWFESYHSNRKQTCKVNNIYSEKRQTKTGVQ